jgi:hypothetical protein
MTKTPLHRILSIESSLDAVSDADYAVTVAKQALQTAVWEARNVGASWASIGEVFGVTRSAAQQRFGMVGDDGTDD